MIEEYKKLLKQKSEIDKQLKQVKAKILEENKQMGFGTFHCDGFDIVIPKKVEWNQDELLAGYQNGVGIISAKFTVSETDFKNLDSGSLRSWLESNRTIKQGTPTIKIKDD